VIRMHFGNTGGPREPRILGVNAKSGQKPDLIPDAKGMVGPTTKAGASTFADVNKAPIDGPYYKLPAGTEMPEGIGVIRDGKEVGGAHAETHHAICPTRSMPAKTFLEKFRGLPWLSLGGNRKMKNGR